MSSSTAPVAKSNLLAIIAADPGMANVQVVYAHPGASIQQEAIYFEQTRLEEQAVALGRQSRDESYVLDLVVSVALDGDDPQTCEERCWALVGIVEGLMRPPVGSAVAATLNGAVTFWAAVEGIDMTPGIAPNGGQRVAIAVMHIRCRSRK